jgi:hypothetical protein
MKAPGKRARSRRGFALNAELAFSPRSDILWRSTSGDALIWNSNGSGGFSGLDLGVVDNGYQIAGTADFNGDGQSDLLWQNTNGEVAIWEMDGTNVTSTGVVADPGPSWTAIGNGRRRLRHPASEHERPGRDLGNERKHDDRRQRATPVLGRPGVRSG